MYIIVSTFQPQQPLLNYTVEAIGPLSCTNDGIYLVGGALSGKAYLWDVCINILKNSISSINNFQFNNLCFYLHHHKDIAYNSSLNWLNFAFGPNTLLYELSCET